MPTMHEQSRTVITPSVSQENIEIETASWIDYYRNKYGSVRRVWCSPKDRPESWVCYTSDGQEYTVQPKRAVPHGTIFVM